MRLAPLLLAGALGCAAPATRTIAPSGDRTVAAIAAGLCAQVTGRVFGLSALAPDANDLFVLVKRCHATAKGRELTAIATAYAWMAVDRDLGPFGVHEFVHVTLDATVRATGVLEEAGDHVELGLTFRPDPRIAVEPVGSLGIEATSWASMLALELAPSAGASPEAVAKDRLRREAETAFRKALAVPIRIAYDARSGTTWTPGRDRLRAAAAVQIAPHGMAVIDGIPAGRGATVHVRVPADGQVAIGGLCFGRLERILDADRRADAVSIDDWTLVHGETEIALPPIDCPWTVAVRTADGKPAKVTLTATPAGRTAPPSAEIRTPTMRWVAIDEATATRTEPADAIAFVLGSDTARLPLARFAPAILELSPGESLFVRGEREAYGQTNEVAEVRIPVDTVGDVDVTLPVEDAHGEVGKVHVKARVRTGPK